MAESIINDEKYLQFVQAELKRFAWVREIGVAELDELDLDDPLLLEIDQLDDETDFYQAIPLTELYNIPGQMAYRYPYATYQQHCFINDRGLVFRWFGRARSSHPGITVAIGRDPQLTGQITALTADEKLYLAQVGGKIDQSLQL